MVQDPLSLKVKVTEPTGVTPGPRRGRGGTAGDLIHLPAAPAAGERATGHHIPHRTAAGIIDIPRCKNHPRILIERYPPTRLSGIPPQIGIIHRLRGCPAGKALALDRLGTGHPIQGKIERRMIAFIDLSAAYNSPQPLNLNQPFSFQRIKLVVVCAEQFQLACFCDCQRNRIRQ